MKRNLMMLLGLPLVLGCGSPDKDDDDDDWGASTADGWGGDDGIASGGTGGAGNGTGTSSDDTEDTTQTTDTEDTSSDAADDVGPDGDPDTEEEEEEAVDDEICAESYSFCGDILIPSDFTGTPRSMAVVLYSSVPPAGPPDGIIAEVSDPEIVAGGRFPLRILPALFNGEYYVWVNLYMEGGGEWAPVNGIDYTGSTASPVEFDGSSVSIDDIVLSLATGY